MIFKMQSPNLLSSSILLLLLLTACGNKEETKEVKAVIKPIKYGKVIRSSSSNTQEYAGTVQSSKAANLSFRVNGNVNILAVKVGDRVRKGQLIARIDATDYRVQVEQANSNLLSSQTQIKSSESQLVNARASYQRMEKLYENNSVSLSDFEQAKSALETAQAAYQASKAQAAAGEKQVEASKNQVTYSSLTAPFSGIITKINIEENEFVGAGSPIATLNAESQPEVNVGVPEVVIANVKKGQEVGIHFSALSEDFMGTVSEVGYSNIGGSTYPVIIRIDKPSEAIRPGMAAHVHFDFGAQQGGGATRLYLPIASVGEDDNGKFVYALNKEGDHYTVQKKKIEIGPLADKGFELKNGLTEGDIVATSGLQSLIAGMKVRLMEK
ncbi:MAG: efflux RND transporter periplasmic adaptor subunit [Bacteroidota bacterium]